MLCLYKRTRAPCITICAHPQVLAVGVRFIVFIKKLCVRACVCTGVNLGVRGVITAYKKCNLYIEQPLSPPLFASFCIVTIKVYAKFQAEICN